MFMSAFIIFRPFLEGRISVLCVGPEIANKNVAYNSLIGGFYVPSSSVEDFD